jgi:hypothetical protein
MNKEIEVVVEEQVLGSDNIKITPFGVEFLNKPTIKEWHEAVLGVQKVHGMMQFYLGDLMVFAESPVTGWGESKYEDLMEATGYEYNTLMQFTAVSRRFSPEFRKQLYSSTDVYNLSWKAFQTVSSLDDVPAKHFLEMVRDSKWTIAKLRDEVAKFKNGGILPEKAERQVEEWRQQVKESLKVIYNSQPDFIEIRSFKGGKLVATETVEIPE